ncbi:MAG: DUF4332 domain-containing protein [Woeseiaceae bacterium]
MEYLIQEIFIYLVIAFVLGAVIGWVVCNQGASKRIAALEAQLSGGKAGTPVESIEGIGSGFGSRLKADGISTTEELLELCTTDDGVARVCKCVDLDENTVRNWGTMADLMRIKGLGGQWAELMWRAGVKSVQDLAQREIGPLRAKMREINDAEHRVAELPGEKRVTKFIAEAQQLKTVLPD